MADPYIDQFETQSYGPFAVAQVRALAMGVHPSYDALFEHLTGVVVDRTKTLGALVDRAEKHVLVTYKSEREAGAVPVALDTLRKLVSYAQSRDGGDDIAADILGSLTFTAVARLRPTRVPAVLEGALKAVEKHSASLPEHAAWTKRLRAAHKAVTELNTRVRTSRSARREMTPDIAEAREAWLTAYAALKLAVESALRFQGKTHLMTEIFDDLAEVHRVADVSDADDPGARPLAPQ